MKTWEIDVEMRVRKTLVFSGPPDEAAARKMAALALKKEIELSSFLKWTDGRRAYRPMPVETVIDNDPQIVAVREVTAVDRS